MAFDSAKRVISGTWGEVWLDSDYVSEANGLQAKVSFNKEDVAMCRRMATDSKVTSVKMTGSLKMHKVNSRMALKIGEEIRNGKDLRFTIVSKLADPDSYGCERVVLKNVSMGRFNPCRLGSCKKRNYRTPFTFTDYEFLDDIEA